MDGNDLQQELCVTNSNLPSGHDVTDATVSIMDPFLSMSKTPTLDSIVSFG